MGGIEKATEEVAAPLGKQLSSEEITRVLTKYLKDDAGDFIGKAGKRVRERKGTIQDAKFFFDRLTDELGVNHLVEPHANVDGGLKVSIADGKTICFRPSSKSGPPTIDIHVDTISGVKKIKFKG